MSKILVAYYSRTGNTEKMANAVAEGARRVSGTEVTLKKAQDVSIDEAAGADGFAFGSPTYFGHMAGLLQNLLEEAYISRSKFGGKPFVAFASGGGGQVRGLESIERVCRAVGLTKHAEGVTSGGAPGDAVLESCRKLGETIADAIGK